MMIIIITIIINRSTLGWTCRMVEIGYVTHR